MRCADGSVEPFSEDDLRQGQFIDTFRRHLKRLMPEPPADSTRANPQRKLQQADYLRLFLFALVNPILSTTRAICTAS